MRLHIAALSLLVACAVFAQSDRGTITGTISDPAGAVVASANIQARNTDTPSRKRPVPPQVITPLPNYLPALTNSL